ncbi:zinc finger protein 135-like [Periplaneta americana]|uniref:zinc finger protein 135-like n=1 Tax=Periplaneta americana TaxID=6978 RepID=UPI0037E73A2E
MNIVIVGSGTLPMLSPSDIKQEDKSPSAMPSVIKLEKKDEGEEQQWDNLKINTELIQQELSQLGTSLELVSTAEEQHKPQGLPVVEAYICEVCHQFFSDPEKLSKHLVSHSKDAAHARKKPRRGRTSSIPRLLPPREDVSKCVFCNEYCELYDLKSRGENRFQCDMCSLEFNYYCKMMTHRRTHTGEHFKCELCCKSYQQRSKFTKHLRSHIRGKPFVCNVCCKAFPHSGALVTHQRIHTGEKPFTCELCSKSFAQMGALVSHKRRHTGEKPFECDICGKRFTANRSLHDHRHVHTGERPFKCKVCNKEYSHRNSFKYHKRTHNKLFKCKICCQTLPTTRATSHLLKHAREGAFKCDLCKMVFTDAESFTDHISGHS